jgi:hypothetical protein
MWTNRAIFSWNSKCGASANSTIEARVNMKTEVTPVIPIQTGRYRHYKGNEYEVVDVARHSETLEELVVYRALYGERGLRVRPRAMFVEPVELDGRRVPRFQYVG